MSNELDRYQDWTEETAIYPEELPEHVTVEMVYSSMGLSDEAGEVLGKMKKAIREDDPEYLDGALDEAGDVLWYLARLADELDQDLSDVAEGNVEKLSDRMARDVLEGEGDQR